MCFERSETPSLPLFWLGAGIGFIISGVTVLVMSEIAHRGRRKSIPGVLETDYSIEENIGSAMQYGAQVLAQAAQTLSSTFRDARSEMIRFGLGQGSAGAGESAWYMDEDAEIKPGQARYEPDDLEVDYEDG